MGKVVAFGGVFVPATSLASLDEAIKRIAQKFGIPDGKDGEIKWSPPRSSWIHKNLHGQERENCYREILQAALDSNCRTLVVAWDTGRTLLDEDRTQQEINKYTFERITKHLHSRDTIGVVVADRPGGGATSNSAFLNGFFRYVNERRAYVSPGRVPINVLTTESHLQRHLQLADLVTGITCAMITGNTRFAEPLFRTIRKMFCTNSHGYVGGTGLKLFPDELINLYHWLLEENLYMKANKNEEHKLPNEAWPYHSSSNRSTL